MNVPTERDAGCSITDIPVSTERTSLDPSPALNLAQLLIFALLANLPLGYLREGAPKFTLRWLVYIHLSVPFIILLRQTHGFSWSVIPFSLACAVLGQFVGGRMYRRKKR